MLRAFRRGDRQLSIWPPGSWRCNPPFPTRDPRGRSSSTARRTAKSRCGTTCRTIGYFSAASNLGKVWRMRLRSPTTGSFASGRSRGTLRTSRRFRGRRVPGRAAGRRRNRGRRPSPTPCASVPPDAGGSPCSAWTPPPGWSLSALPERLTPDGAISSDDAMAEIHARWLMTPRNNMGGRAPRDVLLEKRRISNGTSKPVLAVVVHRRLPAGPDRNVGRLPPRGIRHS